MHKTIIIIGFLWLLTSCKQTENKKDKNKSTQLTEEIGKVADDNSEDVVNKHLTLKENIKNLPREIFQFIPEGYSAIDTSAGDLNLDGIQDLILVLRKNTEEATSNYMQMINQTKGLYFYCYDKQTAH